MKDGALAIDYQDDTFTSVEKKYASIYQMQSADTSSKSTSTYKSNTATDSDTDSKEGQYECEATEKNMSVNGGNAEQLVRNSTVDSMYTALQKALLGVVENTDIEQSPKQIRIHDGSSSGGSRKDGDKQEEFIDRDIGKKKNGGQIISNTNTAARNSTTIGKMKRDKKKTKNMSRNSFRLESIVEGPTSWNDSQPIYIYQCTRRITRYH
jgi:hypothetical protein